MARRPSSLLYRVQRLLLPDRTPESDRALLDRYASNADYDAFRELLDRHGSLVMGACRHVLRDTDLAEDVFQATFLVLALKPTAVRGRDALGPWLYRIARRLAHHALSKREAEQQREQKYASTRSTYETVDFATRELLAVLYEELDKLPEHLRIPVLLCYLQERTQEEAARQLGWSLSTIRRRLRKGTALLKQRLTQRGTTLEAALLAAAISPQVSATVPAELLCSTLSAVSKHITASSQESMANRLAREGMEMMSRGRSKLLFSLFLGTGLLACTAVALRDAFRPADPPALAEPAKAVQSSARTNEEILHRLAALWQNQRDLTSHGRFQVYRTLGFAEEGQETKTREDFYKILSAMDLKDVPDFLRKSHALFTYPQGEGPPVWASLDFLADGHRRLEIFRWSDNDQVYHWYSCRDRDKSVFVKDYPQNNQVSVCDGGASFINDYDLLFLPFKLGDYNDVKWQVVERKNGRVKLRFGECRELEADEETGFIYFNRLLFEETSVAREYLQFGPVTDRAGRTLPTVNISVNFEKRIIKFLQVYYILRADLDAKFTDDDFAIAVPKGTNVLDHRGDLYNPKRRVAQEAVPNVLDYVDTIPNEKRALYPRLKYGTPSPEMSLLAWCTQQGKVEAPNLRGKIVLLDFWGMSCGPCVAELPDVQAAAKKYAGSDLVLIGLHDSSTNIDELTSFARKQGLTYLLAIDRPDVQGEYFGTTHKAFGMRGIPNCAVIDREGRVAFQGDFYQGLEKADNLLAGKN